MRRGAVVLCLLWSTASSGDPSPPFAPRQLPAADVTKVLVELWHRYEAAWLAFSDGWKTPTGRSCFWALLERGALLDVLIRLAGWDGKLPPRADKLEAHWRDRLKESNARLVEHCGGEGPTPAYVEAKRAEKWVAAHADTERAGAQQGWPGVGRAVMSGHVSTAMPVPGPEYRPPAKELAAAAVAMAAAAALPLIVATAPELSPLAPALVVP